MVCPRSTYAILVAAAINATALAGVLASPPSALAKRPASRPSTRVAPPDAQAVLRASRLAAETFDRDWKKAVTPAEKVKLADELLALARDDRYDYASRFALYTIARDMYVNAGDFTSACAVIDEMCGTFEMDAPKMKLAAALGASRTAGAEELAKSITLAISLAEEMSKAERFDLAEKFADIALGNAQAMGEAALISDASAAERAVRAQLTAWRTRKSAEARLKNNPADSNANLTLGEYYCFTRGDWERGVPLLAQCSDTALKAVASEDIKATDDEEIQQRIAAGDAWWNMAQKQPAEQTRDRMLSRAAYWYAQVVSDQNGLENGLEKVKLKRRLAEIEADRNRTAANLKGAARKPLASPEE